jgi:hypothetical protein
VPGALARVGREARQAVGQRADLHAIGAGERLAVRALDEDGHGMGALLLSEGGLCVPGGLRGLRALGQELGGVVGGHLVGEPGPDAGQGDGDDRPDGDDALGVGGDEVDDPAEHRSLLWLVMGW